MVEQFAPAEANVLEKAAAAEDRSLPAVSASRPSVEAATEPERPGGVFGKLVGGDDDIVGLVAYSLYKQNKIDWMRAFERDNNRPPKPEEFSAYIVGENTARRVATYRFLAESTIDRVTSGQKTGFGSRPLLSATLNILYGLVGVAVVAALIVLLRFFITLRH